MATFRVGVGSFNIKDGAVGIGTESSGFGNLKVEGTVKSDQFDVIESGVSTFTRYSGFSANKVEIKNRSTTLSEENQILSDVIVDNSTLSVGLGSTASIGEIGYVCVKHHFSVPTGDTNFRNDVSGYGEGTIRYNTDLGTMEFFNGNEWRQFTYISDIQNSPSSRGRALFGGGDDDNGVLSNISSVQFMTLGSAVTFGDLTQARTNAGGCSSEIRAIFAGGEAPSVTNRIDYNAIASGGTGADFGNLASNHRYKAGCSSSTRGLFGAGSTPSATNVIEYVEISTTGDAVDFGDLMGNGMINSGSFASRTRGFFVDKGVSTNQECQVVTIASKGNAVSYLPQGLPSGGDDAGRGCSNSLRGIFVGAGQERNIDMINLVSDGMATQFGDMTEAKYGVGCSASPIRGILYSGWTASPTVRKNTIEYVTFATMGNAVDFGDATHKLRETSSNVSDCHGGLGGY